MNPFKKKSNLSPKETEKLIKETTHNIFKLLGKTPVSLEQFKVHVGKYHFNVDITEDLF